MTSIDGFFWLTTERDWYVHGIQHGNNKRSEEAKSIIDMRNLNDGMRNIHRANSCFTKLRRRNSQWRPLGGTGVPALPKGYKQQQLKNIKCMERELEEISSLRKKAYKCAYKHGDQQNEVKSSYTAHEICERTSTKRGYS
ncbi:hypothetical protein Tco_0481182 [Tanacetum coccineum]